MLKIIESNGLGQYLCPNCSRMHPAEKLDGKEKVTVKAPAVCERCTCPMDMKEGLAFSDLMAERGHDAGIAMVGRRMRGEAMVTPPEDSMVREPVEAKG